jgi:hypothetical protein
MKKLEVSTNLIPIFSVGMYETNLDPRYLLEAQLEELDQDMAEEFWNLFSNKAYTEHIFSLAKEFLEEKLISQFKALPFPITKVKAQEINSPREYNFATDELYFDLIVPNSFETFIRRWIKANEDNEEFTKFLSESYTSCDGFMSFTPNTPDELLTKYAIDPERCLSAVISFLVRNDIEDNNNDFLEKVNGNTFYTQFIEDSECGKKLLNKIEEFVN